jgi:hypothetical protein
VAFRDGNLYRLYVRMWSEGLYAGKRIVGYTESPTFDSFPDPVCILRPDEDDPADMHFYNSAATKLKDGLYVMFPSAFYTDADVVRPHAAFSSDGRKFERVGREPVMDFGTVFDTKGIYVAPGATPGDEPGTYWFYYDGTNINHDQTRPDSVHCDGGLGRFLAVIKE